jgi:hypothetical protein
MLPKNLLRCAALICLSAFLPSCEDPPIAAPALPQIDPQLRQVPPDSGFEVRGGATSSGVGGDPLTEKQLEAALNLTNWRFPVKVPPGTQELNCRLDVYHGDRYLSTLATSGVAVDHDQALPGEFEIAVMIQFPYEYAGQFEALRHSKEGYFTMSATNVVSKYNLVRKRFQNPFLGKGVDSVGGIGDRTMDAILRAKGSRLSQENPDGPPPSRTKEEERELLAEWETLWKGMKANHQIGLMESSNGTNLRLTFDFGPR